MNKNLRAGLALVLLCLATAASAAQRLETRLMAHGHHFDRPMSATAPLTDGRLFVVEQGGTIQMMQGSRVRTFLTLDVAQGGERGLLGLAFDPGYGDPTSPGYRRFFVNYNDPDTTDTVIASYRARPDGRTADPSTRVEIMRIDQLEFRQNNKGGWIGFKPGDADHLYIGTGDGGATNDPDNHAQNTSVLLGKLLRIDINRDDFTSRKLNYGVPPDNPFVGTPGARGEIFAFGLRNPARASFDSATGDLWINDVGQWSSHEIDFIAAASPGGQNFGWSYREGQSPGPRVGQEPGGLTAPLMTWSAYGASLVGGHVVREAGSLFEGQYVLSDPYNGRAWAFDADGEGGPTARWWEWSNALTLDERRFLYSMRGFAQGAEGELYMIGRSQLARVVTVVPEPATWATMLLGGIGVAAAVRRRRRCSPG